jgi:hypothetical protein
MKALNESMKINPDTKFYILIFFLLIKQQNYPNSFRTRLGRQFNGLSLFANACLASSEIYFRSSAAPDAVAQKS